MFSLLFFLIVGFIVAMTFLVIRLKGKKKEQ